MTKFLASLLSVLLCLSNMLPLCAQALENSHAIQEPSAYDFLTENTAFSQLNTSNQLEALYSALQQTQSPAQQLHQEVQEVLDVLSAPEKEIDNYAWFKELYTQAAQEAHCSALKQAQTSQEKEALTAAYQNLLSEQALQKVYEQKYAAVLEQVQADSLVQTQEYLITLSRRIYQLGQSQPEQVQEMLFEALPVFASVGAVEKDIRTWAAEQLRKKLLTTGKQACAPIGLKGFFKKALQAQQQRCEQTLKVVSALAVLGEGGNSADAQAIGTILQEGYNGIMAPSVIMLASTALLSMNSEDELVAQLHQVAKQMPDVGLFGADFSFLALQDWVKAARGIWEQSDWAIGHEYSFYPGEDKALQNAWTDVGRYLGELSLEDSAQGRAAQNVLRRIAYQTVHVSEQGLISVAFPVFLSGALAGGYKLEPMPYRGYELNGQGKSYFIDTTANWKAAEQKAKELGINISGYAAVSMFYRGKSDLDPYTKLAVNNMLVQAYERAGNKTRFDGMTYAPNPTAQELSSYKNWQTAETIAGGADNILAVVGLFAMGAGVVKATAGGAKVVSRMGRIFKIARSAAAGKGVMANVASYQRVLRLARLQKYGLSSPKLIFLQKVSGFNGEFASILPKPVVTEVPHTAKVAAPKAKSTKSSKPAVQKEPAQSAAKKSRPLPKSKAQRKKAQQQARFKELDLKRAEPQFLNQASADLLYFLRERYELTPDSLKDIRDLFRLADTLPKGATLKRAVFLRVENLLKLKAGLIRNYSLLVRRPVNPGVRVYYLGNKDITSVSRFDAKKITLALEETLYPNTLQDLPVMATRVNSNPRTSWTLHTKGAASIQLPRGKYLSSKETSALYQNLLGCSVKNPCFFTLDNRGTLMLYRADRQLWLRVGEHEVSNKFHIHLHTERVLPVEGGILNGAENVLLNYRIPITGVEFLRPARNMAGGAFVPYKPISETKGYQIFVMDALRDLLLARVAVPLP